MTPRCLARPSIHGMLAAGLSTLALLAALTPAAANPLPDAAVLIHVQPAVGSPEPTTITSCDEIVQYTEQSGYLEFDVFVYALSFQGMPISQVAFGLEWPADWTLYSTEVFHDGEGGITQTGPGQADLDVTWPSCPILEDQVFLVGRLVMEVTHPGSLVTDLNWTPAGHYGCPPQTCEFYAMAGEGQAAVVCSYCAIPCDLHDPCRAELSPPTLELDALQGETTQGVIDATVHGGDGSMPCPITFDATAPWISLDTEWFDWYTVTITVTADATGLATGTHACWVRGLHECVGCTRVLLTVEASSQGVPEDPPVPGPAQQVSWGTLKGLYR